MTQLDTRSVHAGRDDLTALGVHVPPIDLSTTYPLPGVASGGASYDALALGNGPDGGSLVYQRLWNPNVARFEEALAELEYCEGAVAFGSGMAALSAALLATVAAGKPHLVAVRPLYGGSDHLLSTGLLGTTVSWVDARRYRRRDPPRHRTRHRRDPGQPDGGAGGHRRGRASGQRRTGACGQHLCDASTPAASAARRHAGTALSDEVPGRSRRRDGWSSRCERRVDRQASAGPCAHRRAPAPAGGVRAAPGIADAACTDPGAAVGGGEGR